MMGRGLAAAAAVLVGTAGFEPAEAQTELPGIVVSAPKKKRAATRPSRPPREATRVAAPSQPAPAPPPWWGASVSMPATAGFSSTSTLGSAEALSRPSASLGDALSTMPGVSATSFAPLASRPVIRGLGGFRVRTQENGIGSADMANLGEDHAVTIDPLAAEKVEVTRGPAILRYGSQAIGGVVSATTARIPTAIPRNGVAFESRGGLTTVNRGHDGVVALDAGGGNFAMHVDAYERAAGDYQIPGGGVQANSSYRSRGYSAGGSYIDAQGFAGFAYQNIAMKYFIPGIDSAAVKNHIDLRQEKWSSRGERAIREYGIDTVRYWLGYSDYMHDEINGVGLDAVVGSRFKNREIESRAEISHLPVQTALGSLNGLAGVQWVQRRISVAGATEELLAPARAQTVAAFVFEELRMTERLRLQAAGRIESTGIRGTGASFPATFLPPPNDPALFPVNRTYVPASVSGGVLYDLPFDMVGRLTAQHVERAPDPIELFYKGPHDTPRTFEIGSPNMTLEKADTIEIGLKRGTGDFRFEASAYHTAYKNFIFKNFTGIRCGATFASCGQPGATYDQITYSQRDARFIGAEIQIEKDVGPLWNGMWGIEAQYDFVRATFTDGTYVPKIPPHRLGGGVYYRDAQWVARIHLLHAFAQNNLAAFETSTPGYNLLNAEISHTVKLAGRPLVPEITVGLRGENLLNDDIRLHQSYKKDEVLQPGLNVRFFASARLN